MNEDLESFSKKELKLYKKLVICFVLVILASILSILVYYTAYRKNKNELSYCQDSGLFRAIKSNKIVSYTEKGFEKISKDEDIESIGSTIGGDIGICFLGNDFSPNASVSDKIKNYVNSYFTILNGNSIINLSEMFKNAEITPFGDGEHIYYPQKVEDGIFYYNEWITEDMLSIFEEDYLNSMISVTDTSNIPEEVKENRRGSKILGYIPYSEPVSNFMSDKVFEEDGQYFINVKDLEVDGTNGYVYYFEERTIDLMTLEPSKELREINPDNRFTWIIQDDLTEVKGDWCYTYFKNKHHDELGVIKVKVKGNEAVDIEINGFE